MTLFLDRASDSNLEESGISDGSARRLHRHAGGGPTRRPGGGESGRGRPGCVAPGLLRSHGGQGCLFEVGLGIEQTPPLEIRVYDSTRGQGVYHGLVSVVTSSKVGVGIDLNRLLLKHLLTTL